MPRFCELGPNCIGPNKELGARAGYRIGVIPGPPYKKEQRFCSKACKKLFDKESLREQRRDDRAKTKASDERREAKEKAVSDRKIARLKKKGHTHCPNKKCGRPFDEK